MGRVVHNVPLIAQCNTGTCWYACAQMIVRWHRNRPHLYDSVGADVDTAATTSAVCAGNNPINLTAPGAVERVATLANLRTTRGEFSRDGWEHLLTAYGPLWYAGHPRGYRDIHIGAHVVVIYGIDEEVVFINDPWAPGVGLQHTMGLSPFLTRFPRIAGAPMLHV